MENLIKMGDLGVKPTIFGKHPYRSKANSLENDKKKHMIFFSLEVKAGHLSLLTRLGPQLTRIQV